MEGRYFGCSGRRCSGPFIFGTHKMPRETIWPSILVPITANERENIENYLQRTDNCEKLRDNDVLQFLCLEDKTNLENGVIRITPTTAREYSVRNAGAVAGGGIGGYSLTLLLYALASMARIYWKWLHE